MKWKVHDTKAGSPPVFAGGLPWKSLRNVLGGGFLGLCLKASAAAAGAAATAGIDDGLLLLGAPEGFQLANGFFGLGFGADVGVSHGIVLSFFQFSGSFWYWPALATLRDHNFEALRPRILKKKLLSGNSEGCDC
jgi:hypothetical protein